MQHRGRGGRLVLGMVVIAVVVTVLIPVSAVGAADAASTLATTRVSVSSSGEQSTADPGNVNHNGVAALSPEGDYVAFTSYANNLVPGDTNGQGCNGCGSDVFLHNRVTRQTTRVSVMADGSQPTCVEGEASGIGCEGSGGAALSSKGRYVAFGSMAPLVPGDISSCETPTCRGFSDTFVKDTSTGLVIRVGTTTNGRLDITPSGRFVAFSSEDALDPTDTTTDQMDVYVHDRDADGDGVYDVGLVSTKRASVGLGGVDPNNGSTDPAISADGRYVTFHSFATNLAPNDNDSGLDVFVHDRRTGLTTQVSTLGLYNYQADISGNGRFIVYASAPNYDQEQIVLYDRDIDGDGIYDQQPPALASTTISAPGAQEPRISGDGRFVTYTAPGTGVGRVVYVYDRQTGDTATASVNLDGTTANAFAPAINGDGSVVAFESNGDTLVPDDTNQASDVFVRARGQNLTVTKDGTGSGRVTTKPWGVDCGTDCAENYHPASKVTLTASPDSGSGFAGWGGACTGTATCTLSMDQVRSVSATFNLLVPVASHTLAVTKDGAGSGTVTSSPAGIDCGPDCSEAYEEGSQVTLTPTAASGSSFAGWGGACTGTAGCTVTMDQARSVSATFVRTREVSVGDVAVAEGDAGTRGAVFTVSLSKPSETTVTVAYATANSGASAGSDYTAKSGTLSFAPGTTTMPVKVPVTGDTTDDGDEAFTVNLSAPTAATIGDGTGVGNVIDDDPETGRRLAIGDVTVHEGDAGARTAVFTLSLSKPSTSTVSVSFATANGTATKPGDYQGKTGNLSFSAGVTSMVVKVTVNPDTAVEGNETFNVKLSAPSGAVISDGTGVGTIVDND